MRAVVFTKALTAPSATAVSTAQTLAAAGNFAIDGVDASGGVATLDTQRRLLLTFAADETGHTFTIIGANDTGEPIKTTVAGAAAGTVAVPIDFKTVTQFSSNAATTGNVSLGTNTVGSSPWAIFADTLPTPNISFGVEVTGTVNYSVEYTQDPISPDPAAPQSAIALGPNSPNPLAVAYTGLSALAVNANQSFSFVVRGWRLTINSGTGTAVCTGRQAGLASP